MPLLSDAEAYLSCELQPIVDLQSGHAHGFEALLRGYQHLGFTDPLSLIDAFADAGMVCALEAILHDRAVRAFSTVASRLHERSLRLFLNIDSRALEEAGHHLMWTAVHRCQARGFSADQLCWELSERKRTELPADAAITMGELRRLGVRFAADDFGQGRSELRLLFDQQVDYIKIDRYFVGALPECGRRRLFVKTLTGFAHILGLKIIAEGVESAETLSICRDLGCDMAQGWFVGRPVAAEQVQVTPYLHVTEATSRGRRPRREDRTLSSIDDRMVVVPAIRVDASVLAVVEAFHAHPDLTLCPIIDANGAPVGVVPERKIRAIVYNPYGRDLLLNASGDRGLPYYLEKCPCAELVSDLDTALERFAVWDNAECLLVTTAGQYTGMLLPSAMLSVSVQRKLADASAENPLTGLPGNRAVQAALADAARGLDGVKEHRHICYFDFDNFKPFNDVNGFRLGDRAINLFAETLRRMLPAGNSSSLGHIGGDDFVAMLHGEEPAAVRDLIARVLREFAQLVGGLHNERDRLQGWYITHDRYGELRRFPLLRASCAILSLGPGLQLEESAPIGPVIARLKSVAKADRDGASWLLAATEQELNLFVEQWNLVEN